MRRPATIHAQIFALKLMPVILLVIAFASAVHLWADTVDATTVSEHQRQIFSTSQALFEQLLDAQTGVRGFVATGRSVFLGPYDRAVSAIPIDEGRLAMLVAADPDAVARLRRVVQLDANELDSLAREVALMRAGQRDQAHTEVATSVSERAMDELRRDIGELESAAAQQATRTFSQLTTAGQATLSMLLWCVCLSVAFGAVAAWRIRKAIRGRVDLLIGKAQRLANGDAIGAPIGGGDEIAHLDRAFHAMAALLAARTSELERYQLLADRTTCLMLFARQSDGRILHANDAALDAYRYSLDELRALTIDDLRAGEIPLAVGAQLRTPAHTSVTYEADQRRSDGSTFPGELTVEGRLIAGEDVQLSIIRDITERKRAENLVAEALGAAQHAARAKSAFLATMSHEIRTPMNAVIGMTELVLETPLTHEQREALQIVNESGTALLRIIDDVLDFSKIEAGKLNVEIIEFAFAKTIESVAVTLAAQARARGLGLSVFVDPHAPATLYGDAGRIRQVITNLVGNAIKFTHAGSVTIAADVIAATKEWCEVRFSVTDTGIGIAPEHVAHIFEPFAQADASTTRVYGGSGLGLSICRQLVELMGGELQAQSAPGCGSTFWFVLRLRVGKTPMRLERSDLRALVVAGARASTSELTRYLRAWNIEVTTVAGAGDAIAVCLQTPAGQRPFDLAIIDADGLGEDACAIGSALAADSRTAATRRILIAATDHADARSEAMAAGFNVCLTRPLRQSQIYDFIMNIAPVPATPSHDTPEAQGGRRILLAEDNLVNQRVAVKQLYKLGYEVTIVDTGRAALAAVIGDHYDAVLMDCFMPEMDGYAATSAIRRHQSRTGEHTPIIAMTANAQSGDRDTCIAAGMDDYLAKPVTLAALRSVLERYCMLDVNARTPNLATNEARSGGVATR